MIVKALMPPQPGAKPPVDLSVRENLLQLLESSGFKVVSDGEVDCPFHYRDPESYWVAQRSSGVLEAVARRVGEDHLKSAISEVGRVLTQADGSILFRNRMRWVLLGLL